MIYYDYVWDCNELHKWEWYLEVKCINNVWSGLLDACSSGYEWSPGCWMILSHPRPPWLMERWYVGQTFTRKNRPPQKFCDDHIPKWWFRKGILPKKWPKHSGEGFIIDIIYCLCFSFVWNGVKHEDSIINLNSWPSFIAGANGDLGEWSRGVGEVRRQAASRWIVRSTNGWVPSWLLGLLLLVVYCSFFKRI